MYANVFFAVSAMVIGFSIFGDFDRNFPLLSSLDQAISVLSVMAKDDPSARRYEQITSHLRDAAMEHIRRREQRELHRRRKDIHNIFGDPIKENSNSGHEALKAFEQNQSRNQNQGLAQGQNLDQSLSHGQQQQSMAEMPQQTYHQQQQQQQPGFSDTGFGIFNDAIQQQEPWSIKLDMPAEGGGPVLTTSGNLAEGADFAFPTYGFDQMAGMDKISPAGSGVPSLPSYAEEFPLFSLMTDYDQLQDNWGMGVT